MQADSEVARYCGGGVWRTLSLRKCSIITNIGEIKQNFIHNLEPQFEVRLNEDVRYLNPFKIN